VAVVTGCVTVRGCDKMVSGKTSGSEMLLSVSRLLISGHRYAVTGWKDFRNLHGDWLAKARTHSYKTSSSQTSRFSLVACLSYGTCYSVIDRSAEEEFEYGTKESTIDISHQSLYASAIDVDCLEPWEASTWGRTLARMSSDEPH